MQRINDRDSSIRYCITKSYFVYKYIASVWSPTYNTWTVVNPIFDFISSCTNILKRDFLWIVWITKWVFNDFVPCSITGRRTYAGIGCGRGFILDLFTPWCCPSSLRSPFLNIEKHVSII